MRQYLSKEQAAETIYDFCEKKFSSISWMVVSC